MLSVAKIMGLMYAGMGLIFAPLFLLGGLLASAAGQHNNPLAGIFGIGIAVLFPVLFFYNLFARWVGGFELEMELRPKTLTAPYPLIPPVSPASNS